MPTIKFHYDNCPCGSGQLVKDCCLKSCGDLTPTIHPNASSNEECYASELANCTKAKSGEHWISAGVMKILAQDGPLTIGGLPGQAPGTVNQLSVDALRSNILCTRHNSALSPLDALAARFFGSFPHVTGNVPPKAGLRLFCGPDIERWMLKILCGGVYSGILRARTKGPFRWRPQPAWLHHLYTGTPIPAPCGLYLSQKPGDWVNTSQAVEVACLSNGANAYGLIVVIHGFRFIFTMGRPTQPLPADSILQGAAHRPSSFVFSNPGVETALMFDWGPEHHGAQFNVGPFQASPPLQETSHVIEAEHRITTPPPAPQNYQTGSNTIESKRKNTKRNFRKTVRILAPDEVRKILTPKLATIAVYDDVLAFFGEQMIIRTQEIGITESTYNIQKSLNPHPSFRQATIDLNMASENVSAALAQLLLQLRLFVRGFPMCVGVVADAR
jgi:hypothetical protein